MNDKRANTAGDREREKERARLKLEQHVADFRWLMNDPRGRRLMHDWLKDSGLYRKSYTGNSETYYLEGRRSFGLELLGEINTLTPDKFVTMLEEQQHDHGNADHRTE